MNGSLRNLTRKIFIRFDKNIELKVEMIVLCRYFPFRQSNIFKKHAESLNQNVAHSFRFYQINYVCVN